MSSRNAIMFVLNEEQVELERRKYAKMEVRQRRKLLRTTNQFELGETEFRRIFRLSRKLAHEVCCLVAPLVAGRRHRIPLHTKVLLAFRFLASGEFQRSVGEDIAVGQTTVSKYLRLVVPLIVENYEHLIKFPSTAKERQLASDGFEKMIGFPGVIACVGGTHIKIRAPPEKEDDYYNDRRGYHSLNVQMLCDSELRIVSVKANVGGAVEDQDIWCASEAQQEMERVHREGLGDFYVLGGSEYASEPYLLTPIINAADGTPERRYNDAHSSTRSVIGKAFGALKARFRALNSSNTINYEPEFVSEIINCCAILHNLCQDSGMPEPPEAEMSLAHDTSSSEPTGEELDRGSVPNETRDRIIRQYFNEQ